MAVTEVARRSLGDGMVAVEADTPGRNRIVVVVGHDKLDTPELAAVLELRARRADAESAALDARRGRTEED